MASKSTLNIASSGDSRSFTNPSWDSKDDVKNTAYDAKSIRSTEISSTAERHPERRKTSDTSASDTEGERALPPEKDDVNRNRTTDTEVSEFKAADQDVKGMADDDFVVAKTFEPEFFAPYTKVSDQSSSGESSSASGAESSNGSDDNEEASEFTGENSHPTTVFTRTTNESVVSDVRIGVDALKKDETLDNENQNKQTIQGIVTEPEARRSEGLFAAPVPTKPDYEFLNDSRYEIDYGESNFDDLSDKWGERKEKYDALYGDSSDQASQSDVGGKFEKSTEMKTPQLATIENSSSSFWPSRVFGLSLRRRGSLEEDKTSSLQSSGHSDKIKPNSERDEKSGSVSRRSSRSSHQVESEVPAFNEVMRKDGTRRFSLSSSIRSHSTAGDEEGKRGIAFLWRAKPSGTVIEDKDGMQRLPHKNLIPPSSRPESDVHSVREKNVNLQVRAESHDDPPYEDMNSVGIDRMKNNAYTDITPERIPGVSTSSEWGRRADDELLVRWGPPHDSNSDETDQEHNSDSHASISDESRDRSLKGNVDKDIPSSYERLESILGKDSPSAHSDGPGSYEENSQVQFESSQPRIQNYLQID
jgi:hypothetical protein